MNVPTIEIWVVITNPIINSNTSAKTAPTEPRNTESPAISP